MIGKVQAKHLKRYLDRTVVENIKVGIIIFFLNGNIFAYRKALVLNCKLVPK